VDSGGVGTAPVMSYGLLSTWWWTFWFHKTRGIFFYSFVSIYLPIQGRHYAMDV